MDKLPLAFLTTPSFDPTQITEQPIVFDGAGEQVNYAPMNSNLNRGAWKSMENDWAKALEEGKEVKVDIQPVYEGASKRPSSFEVIYEIDGKQSFADFANKAGG